ncbi:MAG TPA: hypothetical protein VF622_07700 [Segetibacter sp.]|jgi:hypothetical protein
MKTLVIIFVLTLSATVINAQEKLCKCFTLKNGKQLIPLKFDFGNWKTGTVQYKEQGEKIRIKLVKEKVNTNHMSGGGGSPTEMTWNEIVNGKVTGVYKVVVMGANVYMQSYTRAKDKRIFKPLDDTAEECEECFR